MCEKPITINFQDTLKLSEEIKFTNTKFIEAIAYYSHPQTTEIINVFEQNDIGEIIKIESNFGYKSRVKPNSRIYNKDLGGGALLDLGCYPISFLMLYCKDFDLFKFVNKKILLAETGVDKYAEAKILYDNNINIEIKYHENYRYFASYRTPHYGHFLKKIENNSTLREPPTKDQ